MPGWKNPLNRGLNLALYLVVCFMLGTGLLLWLRMPPGSRGGGGGLTALGLDRHEWGDAHLVAGLAFFGLTVLHLALNWVWMVKVAGRGRRWPLILGLAAGAVIVLAVALLPVDRDERGAGRSREQHSNADRRPAELTPAAPADGGSTEDSATGHVPVMRRLQERRRGGPAPGAVD